MTELKPCPMPKCPGHPNHSFMGKNNEIWCSECGFSVNGKDRYIVSLIWNNYSPQSLTEKVKLEPLDIQEVQRCIVEDKEAIKWTNIENGNYWPLANAICQRFGKQSLNQASEEDREKLANRFQQFDILAEDILEGKTFCVLSLEKCYEIADALMKEYILVRREK